MACGGRGKCVRIGLESGEMRERERENLGDYADPAVLCLVRRRGTARRAPRTAHVLVLVSEIWGGFMRERERVVSSWG